LLLGGALDLPPPDGFPVVDGQPPAFPCPAPRSLIFVVDCVQNFVIVAFQDHAEEVLERNVIAPFDANDKIDLQRNIGFTSAKFRQL
jgi:hypothetical protein